MEATENTIRLLLTEREGTRLDYKGEDYDWPAHGRFELAKDLMAIANSLTPHGPNGYILVGVEEDPVDATGVVVGVDPTSHQDDADIHQRVGSLLNRSPDFSYAPFELDGDSVGVYEIRWSPRPFYPPRDRGNILKRREARYRDGSATEVASPDHIVAWFKQDEETPLQKHKLELEILKSQIVPRPALRVTSSSESSDRILFTVRMTNEGLCQFSIREIRLDWTISDKFILWAEGETSEPVEEMPKDRIVFPLPPTFVLAPGAQASDIMVLLPLATINEIGQPRGWPLLDKVKFDWFDMFLRIDCESPYHERASATMKL